MRKTDKKVKINKPVEFGLKITTVAQTYEEKLQAKYALDTAQKLNKKAVSLV